MPASMCSVVGINQAVMPLMVVADGSGTNETYPQTEVFNGGFCVLERPSREVRRLLGRQDRQCLPLLARTPRVRVPPRELTSEVAAT